MPSVFPVCIKLPTPLTHLVIPPPPPPSQIYGIYPLTTSPDSNVGAAYWTAAECNVAIICASLPFLRSVITLIFPKLMPSNSYKRTGGRTLTTARSHHPLNTAQSQSQQNEYDLYTIDVKSEMPARANRIPGIEVTTEMTQETAMHNGSSDEERLVQKQRMIPRD